MGQTWRYTKLLNMELAEEVGETGVGTLGLREQLGAGGRAKSQQRFMRDRRGDIRSY